MAKKTTIKSSDQNLEKINDTSFNEISNQASLSTKGYKGRMAKSKLAKQVAKDLALQEEEKLQNELDQINAKLEDAQSELFVKADGENAGNVVVAAAGVKEGVTAIDAVAGSSAAGATAGVAGANWAMLGLGALGVAGIAAAASGGGGGGGGAVSAPNPNIFTFTNEDGTIARGRSQEWNSDPNPEDALILEQRMYVDSVGVHVVSGDDGVARLSIENGEDDFAYSRDDLTVTGEDVATMGIGDLLGEDAAGYNNTFQVDGDVTVAGGNASALGIEGGAGNTLDINGDAYAVDSFYFSGAGVLRGEDNVVDISGDLNVESYAYAEATVTDAINSELLVGGDVTVEADGQALFGIKNDGISLFRVMPDDNAVAVEGDVVVGGVFVEGDEDLVAVAGEDTQHAAAGIYSGNGGNELTVDGDLSVFADHAEAGIQYSASSESYEYNAGEDTYSWVAHTDTMAVGGDLTVGDEGTSDAFVGIDSSNDATLNVGGDLTATGYIADVAILGGEDNLIDVVGNVAVNGEDSSAGISGGLYNDFLVGGDLTVDGFNTAQAGIENADYSELNVDGNIEVLGETSAALLITGEDADSNDVNVGSYDGEDLVGGNVTVEAYGSALLGMQLSGEDSINNNIVIEGDAVVGGLFQDIDDERVAVAGEDTLYAAAGIYNGNGNNELDIKGNLTVLADTAEAGIQFSDSFGNSDDMRVRRDLTVGDSNTSDAFVGVDTSYDAELQVDGNLTVTSGLIADVAILGGGDNGIVVDGNVEVNGEDSSVGISGGYNNDFIIGGYLDIEGSDTARAGMLNADNDSEFNVSGTLDVIGANASTLAMDESDGSYLNVSEDVNVGDAEDLSGNSQIIINGSDDSEVTLASLPQGDTVSNDISTTNDIVVNSGVNGFISGDDAGDMFRVYLQAGQQYQISAWGGDDIDTFLSDPYVYIYDDQNELLEYQDDTYVEEEYDSYSSLQFFTPEADGYYYVAVRPYSTDDTGQYLLEIIENDTEDFILEPQYQDTAPVLDDVTVVTQSGDVAVSGEDASVSVTNNDYTRAEFGSLHVNALDQAALNIANNDPAYVNFADVTIDSENLATVTINDNDGEWAYADDEEGFYYARLEAPTLFGANFSLPDEVESSSDVVIGLKYVGEQLVLATLDDYELTNAYEFSSPEVGSILLPLSSISDDVNLAGKYLLLEANGEFNYDVDYAAQLADALGVNVGDLFAAMNAVSYNLTEVYLNQVAVNAETIDFTVNSNDYTLVDADEITLTADGEYSDGTISAEVDINANTETVVVTDDIEISASNNADSYIYQYTFGTVYADVSVDIDDNIDSIISTGNLAVSSDSTWVGDNYSYNNASSELVIDENLRSVIEMGNIDVDAAATGYYATANATMHIGEWSGNADSDVLLGNVSVTATVNAIDDAYAYADFNVEDNGEDSTIRVGNVNVVAATAAIPFSTLDQDVSVATVRFNNNDNSVVDAGTVNITSDADAYLYINDNDYSNVAVSDINISAGRNVGVEVGYSYNPTYYNNDNSTVTLGNFDIDASNYVYMDINGYNSNTTIGNIEINVGEGKDPVYGYIDMNLNQVHGIQSIEVNSNGANINLNDVYDLNSIKLSGEGSNYTYLDMTGQFGGVASKSDSFLIDVQGVSGTVDITNGSASFYSSSINVLIGGDTDEGTDFYYNATGSTNIGLYGVTDYQSDAYYYVGDYFGEDYTVNDRFDLNAYNDEGIYYIEDARYLGNQASENFTFTESTGNFVIGGFSLTDISYALEFGSSGVTTYQRDYLDLSQTGYGINDIDITANANDIVITSNTGSNFSITLKDLGEVFLDLDSDSNATLTELLSTFKTSIFESESGSDAAITYLDSLVNTADNYYFIDNFIA